MNIDNSAWMTIREACRYARCGPKTLYREVHRGRLRAARIGGRREIRLRREWLDAWLEKTSLGAAAVTDWLADRDAA